MIHAPSRILTREVCEPYTVRSLCICIFIVIISISISSGSGSGSGSSSV
jgi:hypothetical protein